MLMQRTLGNLARLAICLLLPFAAGPLNAAEIVGVGNFSHIVADLERSAAFYGDALGLERNLAPTEFTDNPAIMRLGDTLGARSRIATFSIPGSELGVELIEYTDIGRRPQQIRFQDPGAGVLQLRVRELDAVLDRVRASAGRVWTPSGEPVRLGETTRIIFVQDPDGFFVELIENTAPGPDAPASGNVLGASFELIVADTLDNAAFYREGFRVAPQVAESFDDTKLLNDTVATSGAAFRRTSLTIPGTSVSMAFLEFRGIARKRLDTRVQDPGTSILQLYVDDVAAVTDRLAAAGGTIVSTGGAPVDLGDGRMLSIVRGPSNLFLELIPAPAGQ